MFPVSSLNTLSVIAFTLWSPGLAVSAQVETNAAPLVPWKGMGLFEVGPLLAQRDFEDLDDWVVQIQPGEGPASPDVKAHLGNHV